MSRPTVRVLTLLELLQSGGIRTVAELADRLGVDGRTVRRYVDQLIDLDVPVESVRGRYGGYRLAPGYRLPPLMLSDDEALAVLLGLVAGRRAGLDDGGVRRARRQRPRSAGCCPSAWPAGSTPSWNPSPSRLRPASAQSRTPRSCSPSPTRYATDRPISIRYTDRDGRRSERTLHAVRDRRPLGPVVRHGRGSRDRRGPDLPARSHRRREDPARLVRAARRTRSGAARAVRVRHGCVPV